MAEEVKSLDDPVRAYEDVMEHHAPHEPPGLATAIEAFVKFVGHGVMWVNVLLVAVIITQVALRYTFNLNFPKLDEIQWHFYGLVTMIGISYALVTDSHVRVDVLHMQLNRRTQRIIEVAC